MEIGEPYYAAIRVGQQVGDFTVATYNPIRGGFEEFSFKRVRQEKKWVVLFFYPSDFTFVCPTELSDLAQLHARLDMLGVEVLSISTDTKFSHLAWRSSERLLNEVLFQMGADPTGTLSRYFGVYDETEGTALRGTFIINPDGILVSAEVNYYNVGRNLNELLRKLNANTYLRANPEQVCPSGWDVGDQTLTPSEEMVGDVYGALHGKSKAES